MGGFLPMNKFVEPKVTSLFIFFFLGNFLRTPVLRSLVYLVMVGGGGGSLD